MADCRTQIPLADIGRDQARSIGEAMRRLGIPIGEVIASPYCRTMDTARFIAGRVRADNAVAGQDPDFPQSINNFARLREIVATPPAVRTNRVIVGHHAGFFEGLAAGPGLLEGEVGIFRMVDGRRVLIARLRAEDWQAYAAPANSTPPAQRSSAPDALLALRGQALATALRFGGYTIYIRTAQPQAAPQDVTPVVATDCPAPRLLAERGRAQALAIGAAISTMRMKVTEVLAGPYCHTLEMARLVTGLPENKVTVLTVGRGAIGSVNPPPSKLFAAPAERFGLRIIVGDGADFSAAAGAPPLEEGDAAILRSADNGSWGGCTGAAAHSGMERIADRGGVRTALEIHRNGGLLSARAG